jgi:regulator of protease activity HflC (stomatin/prohibitin superfamily)
MENTPPYLTALFCIYGIFILLLVVSLVAAIRIVREDKRLSVYRLGRYLGEKGPGLVLLIPFVDRGVIKDLGGEEKAPGQSLIDAVGETRTIVFTSGKVLVDGEEWDATSQAVISAGRRVRVVKMILEVEEE